jgi:hypothetical protein
MALGDIGGSSCTAKGGHQGCSVGVIDHRALVQSSAPSSWSMAVEYPPKDIQHYVPRVFCPSIPTTLLERLA